MTCAIASGAKIDYHQGMGLARSLPLTLLVLTAAGACSDPASSPDAGPDAYNPCPAGEWFYTGELVSWDSTSAVFKGVFDAAFTVEGQAARADKTSPNGRFELCIVDTAVTQLSVEPTASSMFFRGLAVAESAVTKQLSMVSLRSFTPAQEAAFAPRIVAGKAHVFVDVSGKQRAVSLAGASAAAPTFVFDGAAWSPATASSTGAALFFANLEPSAAPATASMSGPHLGGKHVPLIADRITYLTIIGK